MDFSGNRFSGSIAPEINNYRLLTFVDLSRNNLFGVIPEEITGMPILNYLNLSRNHLEGSIRPPSPLCRALLPLISPIIISPGVRSARGQFSLLQCHVLPGNPNLCGPYLGPCRSESKRQWWQQAYAQAFSFKLKLVRCRPPHLSIVFAIAAIIKTRSLKKASEARAWKLTAFQRLDFTLDDVLDSLQGGESSERRRRHCVQGQHA
ncbi:hypothetical protein HPP92_024668 [Vanilla planifolia]|uniref:Uncharacterized protein n=1 Tax=Vanilla planifolia TaxID=51239 RepID=A0A835UD71_VANPL|nr:hypothetical protein HPP92_024962 [Vanilla planifolia]KAG0456880.1 hypothetical protein HPP92_024668 [Vanilla planifolia]